MTYYDPFPTMSIIIIIGLITSLVVALFKYFLRVRQSNLRFQDLRPPVLLLRSFKRDNLEISRKYDSFFPLNLFMMASITFEEKLVEILKSIGPVVAIGRPGEKVQPLGAARTYSKDEEWKNEVMRIAKNSCLVVIIVDDTPGLSWELEQVLKSIQLSKLLLIIPPLKECFTLKERIRWFEEWEKLRIKFSFIPPINENSIAVKFDNFRIPSVILSHSSLAIEQLSEIEKELLR